MTYFEIIETALTQTASRKGCSLIQLKKFMNETRPEAKDFHLSEIAARRALKSGVASAKLVQHKGHYVLPGQRKAEHRAAQRMNPRPSHAPEYFAAAEGASGHRSQAATKSKAPVRKKTVVKKSRQAGIVKAPKALKKTVPRKARAVSPTTAPKRHKPRVGLDKPKRVPAKAAKKPAAPRAAPRSARVQGLKKAAAAD
ncbi:hypothetical protein M885DRAFT_444908 [Pelagophyceae sp. CCMP2097]|nr:hypothetical protein M885DRAFT_444908 [Pelagophyceae sp. CCMP2097]